MSYGRSKSKYECDLDLAIFFLPPCHHGQVCLGEYVQVVWNFHRCNIIIHVYIECRCVVSRARHVRTELGRSKKCPAQVVASFEFGRRLGVNACWIGRLQFYSRSLHFIHLFDIRDQTGSSSVDTPKTCDQILGPMPARTSSSVETRSSISVRNGIHLSHLHTSIHPSIHT